MQSSSTMPEVEKPVLGGWEFRVVALLTTGGVLLTINHIFSLAAFGWRPSANAYYYLFLACLLPLVFLVLPASKSGPLFLRVIDYALAGLAFATCFYLAMNAEQIARLGWDLAAPVLPTVAAGILCALAVEALRRSGGTVLLLICLLFGVFPLFADHMPGFLWGSQYTFEEMIRAYALGSEGVIGVPLRVLADTLVGFLIYGVVLVVTGGGEFFMRIASALMGGRRGGPAKVSILSSGFFGSLSGSVVSNVVSTGAITIPTMKRNGYTATYAGAIEACASTGGSLMPPVMGAVAFVMAAFLNTSYAEVITAAAVPSILFYLALFLQADAYAARKHLKGLPPADRPAILPTLRDGWLYLASLAVLMYVILVMRLESQAPYFAAAVLLAGHVLSRRGEARALSYDLVVSVADSIVKILGVLAGVGLIIGALSITGVGTAFSRELIQYAGGNVYLLLVLGAVTSFVLGMGMTATACYIFLAVVLAPALISGGLNPMASHLFILYYGMLSFITPPVALGAVAAAGISGASVMKTAFTSVRIGAILFILPFIFVLHPALILQGTPFQSVLSVLSAIVAVWTLTGVTQGYLLFLGAVMTLERLVLAGVFLLLLVPGLATDIAGAGILVGLAALRHVLRLRGSAPTTPNNQIKELQTGE